MLLTLSVFSLIALAAAGHHGTVNSKQEVKVKEMYDSVVTKDYYPTIRPYGVNGTDSTYVVMKVKDVKVIHVDDDKGLFTFQAYAIKSWVDSRLAYNDTSVSYIPLKECKAIWGPTLFSPQGIEVGDFPISSPKARSVRIFPNGRVKYCSTWIQTVRCNPIFKKDVKEFTCPFQILPFGHMEEEMTVMFYEKGEPVTTTKEENFLPKYTYGGVTASKTCTPNPFENMFGAEKEKEDHDHKVSCVQVDFKFTRRT